VALKAIGVDRGSRATRQVDLSKTRWKFLDCAFVIHRCQTNLPEIVGTLGSASCFANTLHGWQEHANQNSNDGNDDK
jgi:hypothetical protein